MKDKELTQNDVSWSCRFHPVNFWHEVGCPHCEWTKEQLLSALIAKKKFEEDKIKILIEPKK